MKTRFVISFFNESFNWVMELIEIEKYFKRKKTKCESKTCINGRKRIFTDELDEQMMKMFKMRTINSMISDLTIERIFVYAS